MSSFNIQKCQICQGDIVIDQETMENCCSKCGFVIDAPAISLEPEQLSSPGEPSKSRTGSKTSNKFHDFGLSTNINEQNKDAAGNPLSSKIKTQMQKLRKIDRRYKITKSMDVGLRKALFFLNNLEESLVLPVHVVEESSKFYRHVQDRRLVQGRTIVEMMTACVYASCRINSIPITIKEISKIAGVSYRNVGSSYNLICRELEIQSGIIDPVKNIPKAVNNLHLDQNVTIVASNIINLAKKEGITAGKSPTGLVAAAIYLASIHVNKPVTQRVIGEELDVTEATIRNRCKELKKILKKKNFQFSANSSAIKPELT